MDALPRCDTIIALWGITSGSPAALNTNITLAETAHDMATRLGARRVFHMSSAGVYGPGRNMTEDGTRPRPITPYGRAKLRMEHRVAQLAASSRVAHCCLRLANVVGADSLAPALDGTRPAMLDRFADGSGPVRSYIAPGMLARVLAGLAIVPPDQLPNVLNVAARDPVEMADLLHAAGRQITWRDAPRDAVHRVTLDVRRLSRVLPLVDLTTNAAAMIADHKKTQAA